MIPKMIAALLISALMVAPAQAFVSLSVNVFALNDEADQQPGLPLKTIAVVDRDGDGLVGFSRSVVTAPKPTDSFLWDPDDWIVENAFVAQTPAGQWNESAGDDAGEFGFNNFLVTGNYGFDLAANGLEEGDEVFLFWYPGLPSDATNLNFADSVGFISLGTLPGDGGTLSFSNQNNPDSRAVPIYPEPASLALLGMGGLVMLNTRRQRRL